MLTCTGCQPQLLLPQSNTTFCQNQPESFTHQSREEVLNMKRPIDEDGMNSSQPEYKNVTVNLEFNLKIELPPKLENAHILKTLQCGGGIVVNPNKESTEDAGCSFPVGVENKLYSWKEDPFVVSDTPFSVSSSFKETNNHVPISTSISSPQPVSSNSNVNDSFQIHPVFSIPHVHNLNQPKLESTNPFRMNQPIHKTNQSIVSTNPFIESIPKPIYANQEHQPVVSSIQQPIINKSSSNNTNTNNININIPSIFTNIRLNSTVMTSNLTSPNSTLTSSSILSPNPTVMSPILPSSIFPLTVNSNSRCQRDLETLSATLRVLRLSGFYYESLSQEKSLELLLNKSPGTFLVRNSSNPRHIFTLSVQTVKGPTSIRLHYSNGYFYFDCDDVLINKINKSQCVIKLIELYVNATKENINLALQPNEHNIMDSNNDFVSNENVSNKHHVWLDSNTRKYFSKILLTKPLLKEVPKLQHLCRNNVFHNNIPVSLMDTPRSVISYLREYPYSV